MKRLSFLKGGLIATSIIITSQIATANDVPPPPPLAAEGRYLSNVISVNLEGEIEDVRNFMASNPVTGFLEPTGNIPQIVDVVVLEGDWGEPGSLRRVDLEGGSWVHEQVLTNDDDEFTYQIWDITAPAGRFINHIHGQFRFTDTPNGTQIVWSYSVKPRFFFARPSIRNYLDDDFAPFMESGLSAFATAYSTSRL